MVINKNTTMKKTFRHFMEILINLSNGALLSIWMGATFGFAIFYWLMAHYMPEHGPTIIAHSTSSWEAFGNSLYFSIITATSTGYGDIVPIGFSKFLASIQSIISLSTFAILITKLVSRNQDVALQQVQRLTSEESLHNLFDEFFLIRKDCDRFMQEIDEHNIMSAQHWNDLLMAYERFQAFFSEVPSFYTEAVHFYSIDSRREKVLIEAVRRTLHRMTLLLQTMDRRTVDWKTHEDHMKKFLELLETTKRTFVHWQENIPEERRGSLKEFEESIQKLQSFTSN